MLSLFYRLINTDFWTQSKHPTALHMQKENRMSSEPWTGYAHSGSLSAPVISIRKGKKRTGTHPCPISRQVQNKKDMRKRQFVETGLYPEKKNSTFFPMQIVEVFWVMDENYFSLFAPTHPSAAEPSVSLSMHIPSACDAHNLPLLRYGSALWSVMHQQTCMESSCLCFTERGLICLRLKISDRTQPIKQWLKV